MFGCIGNINTIKKCEKTDFEINELVIVLCISDNVKNGEFDAKVMI